ncbi:transposase [Pseudonocardia nigra]|uniref:transposase n=1 Tax=Pseudonocardia nigra TaxID=1921578 RepID=UPI001C5E9073|nr:transposase [Pseudonocardia nigra]
MAAGHSVEPGRWAAVRQELLDRVAGRFGRVEPRRRFAAFLDGMLVELPRKNCATITEHVGETSPHGMQHFLTGAVWDTDAVAVDLREFVVEHFAEPDAVLVVEETGDLKKGDKTVGVQRSTPGPRGGSRTPRSRSISPTPAGPGTR